MIIEMHTHTAEHSACSSISALDLVRRALAKELQGIVLTDHHYLWTPEEIAQLRERARLPEYFLVLAGQEVRTADFGDVLVYGAQRTLEAGTTLARIRGEWPRAALVWAHPYRKQNQPGPQELCDPLFDGVEIFNSNHSAAENTRALRDWHRYKFTAIGGTDTHSGSYVGTYTTIFDHPFGTIEELAEEIRQGRCRPFFKEIPKSGSQIQVTELTIGTKGLDDRREKIIVKTHNNPAKWKTAERAYHLIEEIAAQGFSGGLFRVPRPLGCDMHSHTLIEEGVRGKSLFEKLLRADVQSAREYMRLAARWLAKLHNARLRISPAEEYFPREEKRLAHYLRNFSAVRHRHARRVQEITETVWSMQQRIYGRALATFIQGHGDYHPKNILVGQDNPHDRTTTFVAAIDFDSSLCMPQAFDLGTFVAQYRNQLYSHPQVRKKAPLEVFLDTYRGHAGTQADFSNQVRLFQARTNLSIAAYLFKVRLGDSEDLHRVLVETEQCLAGIAMHQSRFRPPQTSNEAP
ncbi:phosphotransferase [Geoalkalibacter halelectricus]|uniref:phosphotransferase n=1 Tax=Geoalkalibacter halelectricus TaxID=2847045 RepID=UPI003D1A4B9A